MAQLRWYDYWLKRLDNGVLAGPPVQVFLMGANHWLDLENWPPAGVSYRPAYLRAGTGAEAGSLNNGGLTFVAPSADDEPDRFMYDPRAPVHSLLGYPQLGPRDHHSVEVTC